MTICIRQVGGGCAQFKVDVIIPPDTVELVEDLTLIWHNLDSVNWI